jgi:uncharacterized repeat protein (TIGR01451 family)
MKQAGLLIQLFIFGFMHSHAQWGQINYMNDQSYGNWEVADLNEDGIDDLIGDYYNITLYIGQSSGTYYSHTNLNLPDNAQCMDLKICDLNLDGHQDIVVASIEPFNDIYRWHYFKGDGQGHLFLMFSFDFPDLCWRLSINDFDNNGWPDVFAPTNNGHFIYFNMGSNEFIPTPFAFEVGTNPRESADMDGDGLADLVSNQSQSVMCWFNQGNGTFAAADTLATLPFSGSNISLLDYDLDEDIDIVYSVNYNGLKAMRNDGENVYTATNLASDPSYVYNNYKLSDLDNDGDLDVVAGIWNINTKPYRIFKNNNGTYIPVSTPWLNGLEMEAGVNIADINGDNVYDIIYSADGEGGIFSSMGLGNMQYGELNLANTESKELIGALLYDFDENGNTEVLVSDQYYFFNSNSDFQAFNRTCLYRKDSEGIVFDRIVLSEFQDETAAFKPVRVVDWNNDGYEDVLGWRAYTNEYNLPEFSLEIILHNGNFQFEWQLIDLLVVEDYSQDALLGDIDGDGDLDVIIRSDEMYFRLNDGSGNLTQPIVTMPGLTQTFIEMQLLEDFNNDGLADLVFQLNNSNLYIAIGNGNGTFGTPIEIGNQIWQDDTREVKALDLNQDGNKDIALSYLSFNNMDYDYKWKWLKNLGNNSWAAFPPIIIGDTFSNNDMDSDGDADLIYSENNTLLVRYFNNDSYGSPITIATQGISGWVAMDYFNADGLLDIVGYNGNGVIWIGDVSQESPRATGRVYYDANANGYYDGGESLLSGQKIFDTNSLAQAFTNSNGEYQLFLPAGEAQISLELPSGWTSANGQTIYNILAPAEYFVADSIDFGIVPMSNLPALDCNYITDTQVCSSETNHWVNISNLSGTNQNIQIKVQIHEDMQLAWTLPQADSVIGNEIIFNMYDLGVLQTEIISLGVTNPNSDFMGEEFEHSVSIHNDLFSAFATDSVASLLFCSYDPNDKQVWPIGTLNEGYVKGGELLEYTIRFQNTGNYRATDVVVVDSLSAYLNWGSLQLMASSHPITSYHVDASGVAKFAFNHIFLPDSTTDSAGSHGFVKFIIGMSEGIEPGSIIENFANIYFDQNEAIITNTTINKVCSIHSPMPIVPIVLDGYKAVAPEYEGVDYQWFYNEDELPAIENNECPIDSAGNYLVIITDAQQCKFSSQIIDVDLSHLPINALLRPNPTNDKTYLWLSGIEWKTATMRILSNQGSLVAESAVLANPAIIDEPLVAGIYLVQLIDKDGKTIITKRLVVE